jgi:hypothetical protein
MAFELHRPAPGPASSGLFAAALAGSGSVGSARPRNPWRCATCGDEIPYDALAALCRCSQECYPASSLARPVPAHDAAA